MAIDVQDPFLAKLPASEAAALVARIRWLLGVGDHLGIPIVVTAEDLHRVGPIVGDRSPLPSSSTAEAGSSHL